MSIEDWLQFEEWKMLLAAIGGYARNYDKNHPWWPDGFWEK